MYSKILIDKKIGITNIYGFGLSGEHNFFKSIDNCQNQNLLNMVVCGVCRDYNEVMKASFIDIGQNQLGLLKNVKLNVGEKIIVQIKKLPHGEKGFLVSDKIVYYGEFFDFELNGNRNMVDRSFGSGVEKQQATEFLNIIGEQYLGINLKKNALLIKPAKLMENIMHIHQKLSKMVADNHNANEILLYPVDEIEKFLWKIDFDTIIETNCSDLFNKFCTSSKNINFVKKFDKEVDTIFKDLLECKRTLPNGGEILIETLETLTFIDVNSSGQINSKDESSHKVNLAAAKEIAKILTFGGIGGTIIIDFIKQKNRSLSNELLVVLKSAFKRLNAGQVDVLGYSKSGFVEITKKRIGNSIFDKYITRKHNTYTNEYYAQSLLNDCVTKYVNARRCYIYCNQEICDIIKSSLMLAEVKNIIKCEILFEISDNFMVVYKNDS